MSNSVFGPMPIHFANKLQSILKEQNHSLEVFTTEESLSRFREHNKSIENFSHPTYSGGIDSVYVSIPKESLLIVKSELEKMGFPIVLSSKPGDFSPEYLCPKCNYKADLKGMCPKHKVPTLEFLEWMEFKRDIQKKNQKYISLVALIVVFSLLAWAVYNLATDDRDYFRYQQVIK